MRFHFDPRKLVWRKATVIHQPTDSSPRRYEVQPESGARFCRNRRHIHPAVQDQPQDIIQAQDIPEPEPGLPRPGPVKHSSFASAGISNDPAIASLRKQSAPDPFGTPSATRSIRPPSRLIEEV